MRSRNEQLQDWQSILRISVCFAILSAVSDITQFISGRLCERTSYVALKIGWAHDPSEITARLLKQTACSHMTSLEAQTFD